MSAPLRIVQVSPFDPRRNELGGPLELIRQLAAHFNDGHNSIRTVAPGIVQAGSVGGLPGLILCQELCHYRTVSITRLRPLKGAIQTSNVVLIHGYRHWLPVCAARECRRLGLPYVVHLHGMLNREFRSWVKKWVFDRAVGRSMLTAACTVVCSSQREATLARRILPELSRITVLPHGVGAGTAEDHGISRSETLGTLGINPELSLVVTMGRINRSKNFEATIRGVRRLPGVALIVVGPPEDRSYWSYLQHIAKQEGLGGRVRFLPGIYGAAKRSLRAAAPGARAATDPTKASCTVPEYERAIRARASTVAAPCRKRQGMVERLATW